MHICWHNPLSSKHSSISSHVLPSLRVSNIPFFTPQTNCTFLRAAFPEDRRTQRSRQSSHSDGNIRNCFLSTHLYPRSTRLLQHSQVGIRTNNRTVGNIETYLTICNVYITSKEPGVLMQSWSQPIESFSHSLTSSQVFQSEPSRNPSGHMQKTSLENK